MKIEIVNMRSGELTSYENVRNLKCGEYHDKIINKIRKVISLQFNDKYQTIKNIDGDRYMIFEIEA